jgi:GT2 family glycosyltransferase
MAVAAEALSEQHLGPVGPAVAVVLVAYDSGGDLLRCVAAIDRDEEGIDEIVIVNNGLEGPELEIAGSSPRIRVVTPPENIGFAAGCNFGAAFASSEILVFLNPDTVPAPGALRALVRTLEDESVAIATPRLRLLHEPDLLNGAGNVVHISGLGWCDQFAEPALDVREARDVPAPSGAAFAIRAAEYRELGGLREELFMYYEDQDLGWRVQMQGRRVVMNPRADVYHDYDFYKHQHKHYFLERNRFVFLLLAFSVRTLLVLAPVLVAAELAMCLLAARQGWLKEKLRGWVWSARHVRVLLRLRRETQRSRRIRDRELVRLLTPAIDPGAMAAPPIVRLFNPLLAAYWAVASRLI